MSKIGKQPIIIPENVKVELKEELIKVIGPKGELTQKIRPELEIKKSGMQILVKAKGKSKMVKALHGLIRSLVANMIEGVTKGFEKKLELHGVGYRASLEEGNLKLALGFSHPVVLDPPAGIEFQVEESNLIKVIGIDKQKVGEVAAKIREIRKSEPYKGKGIRYRGEVIKKKPGKAAKVGAAETG